VRLLHSLTHSHRLASKPEVGVLLGCTSRLTRRTTWGFSYPEGDQPTWIPIRAELLGRLTSCTSRNQVEQLLGFGA
jgi:hypothetical protein